MSNFITRCRGIIENRGFAGFIVFVLKRVLRHTRDIVFETDPRESESAFQGVLSGDLCIHVIDKNNITDLDLADLLSQALAGENAIYRNGLTRDNCMVVVSKGETVVHVSFVQFDTSYKKILNESYDVPLIGNCWTSPDWRGRGIYPCIIRECFKIMAARGFDRIVISCAPDNYASIAGIEKVGFRRVRDVNTYILLTKIMLQKLTTAQGIKYRLKFL